MTDSREHAARLAFRERYAADHAQEKRPELADYVRLWPDHQSAIAQEYLAAEAARGTDDRAPDSGEAPSGSQRLGPYVIEKEIGRGAQGAVYLATDTRLHRKVALKVLHGLGPGAEAHLHRFRREAEVASRLDHPGICGVHDAGVEGGVPYIAMPYVEGNTLGEWIGRRQSESAGTAAGSLVDLDSTTDRTGADASAAAPEARTTTLGRAEVSEVLRIFEKAAIALHAAHEAGILHRDIKPGNVMVTKDGQPVILDFGLARLEDYEGDAPSLTRSGDIFGTPAYMSPEQIAGTRIKLDRRSDVYSLGVTLYECLTSRRPFEGATREALYQAILSKSPIDPRKLNRSIPKDLQVVMATAIERDRDRRYASAEAMAKDLQAVLEGRPIQARPVGPVGRFVRWSKREPAKAALLAVILVAFPTIATLVTSHVKDRPQVEAARLAATEQAKDELLTEASYEIWVRNPKKAVELYTQVLEMEGNSPEAAGGLVLASLGLGNPGEALRLLDRHHTVLGDGAAACLLRADALYALGKKEEARTLVRTTPAPRSAFEHHLLAAKELQRGEAGDQAAFDRALRHVTTAILLSPAPRLPLYSLRAEVAGQAKNRAAAVETAAGLRNRWPGSARAQFSIGFALAQAGDPTLLDEAIAAWREAIRLKPEVAETHGNLGRTLLERGLHDEAIAECREAIRLEPGSVGVRVTLGEALNTKGLVDDAIPILREAIRLSPASVGAQATQSGAVGAQGALCDALLAKGSLDEAIAAGREAVRLNPRDARAHATLGSALRRKNLLDEAIASHREAIRLKPDLAEAHFNVGLALSNKGLLDEAIAACREAIRLKPDYANAYYNLGIFLRDRGLLDEAIPAFREAVRLNADPVAQSALAGVLQSKGLIDEAVAAHREAIRMKPDFPDAHYSLGVVLATSGLSEDAMAAYREAIRVKPDYAEAHCNLGGVLASLGEFRESLVEYRTGHHLGSRRRDWSYPSEQWVATAEERMAEEEELEAQLSGHVAAGTQPEGASELVVLARVALNQGRPALAARWFQAAFAESPDFADAIGAGHRRLAARAAILASIGGTDFAHAIDDATRSTWRVQALAWLEAEITAIKVASEAKRLTAAQVRMALVPLSRTPDLAAMRGTNAIAKLPEAERPRWTKLWADIDALLASLDRKPETRTPETRR